MYAFDDGKRSLGWGWMMTGFAALFAVSVLAVQPVPVRAAESEGEETLVRARVIAYWNARVERAAEVPDDTQRAARRAIPVLERLLQSSSADVHLSAARALTLLHPCSQLLVPVLADCLRLADPKHRCNAARLLGDIGPGARSVVPSLVGMSFAISSTSA